MRTIDAPGVETTESDKSQYSASSTGTAWLVAGFANKSQPYVTQTYTSKTALVNGIGEPENEAERYLYNAALEAINQNAKLYLARLPYDNESNGKACGMKYSVGGLEALSGYSDVSSDSGFKSWSSSLLALAKIASEAFSSDADQWFIDSFVTAAADKEALTYSLNSAVFPLAALSGMMAASEPSKSYLEKYASGKTAEDLEKEYLASLDLNKYLEYSEEAGETLSSLLNEYGSKAVSVLSSDSAFLSTYGEAKHFTDFPDYSYISLKDGATEDAVSKSSVSGVYYEAEAALNSSAFIQGLKGSKILSSLAFSVKNDTVSLNSMFSNGNTDYSASSLSAALSSFGAFQKDAAKYVSLLKYSVIKSLDSTVDRYFSVSAASACPEIFDLDVIDKYRTGELKPEAESFIIIDKTFGKYSKVEEDANHKSSGREMIGILPVVTTAENAMYVQSLITLNKSLVKNYESVNSIKTLSTESISSNTFLSGDLSLQPQSLGEYESDSISQEAASQFPTISYKDDGTLDRANLKKIGIVVFKGYLDSTTGNKVSFTPIESFVGSLGKDDTDPSTGVTVFIDKIVNSQSDYIELFSNCYSSASKLKDYKESCDMLMIEPTVAGSLGFYESMCKKTISLKNSILGGLSKVFSFNQDINEKDIDLVVDAGVSNIAQYIASVGGTLSKIEYSPASSEASLWKLKSSADSLTWKSVISLYNDFCKLQRKDCMFIADGLRPLVLQGEKKIVRYSKPDNTIDADILPYIKYMSGVNSSYGAGYLDWFQKSDEFTGDFFWCPPSIQAAGIYTYTDTYYNYFDAPAGLNRGIVYSAIDVAFSPTNKQAGVIYTKNWNYAINYPADGIVLEGQKTFQTKASAFDRVNVRRLFLRLERSTFKAARYFVYEGNTAFNRQRFVDTITPMYESAKISGGIYDYKIIADETLNTAAVIDNNEMRCKIGIKPTKTMEYILIDFTALTTGGSFDEM